jgi:hypothetical protein
MIMQAQQWNNLNAGLRRLQICNETKSLRVSSIQDAADAANKRGMAF